MSWQKENPFLFCHGLILCGEHTDFQVFTAAPSPASFMFWGLLVAPTSFRKPHLNMLTEATVAQAPRAHFDRCRSEGLFFHPEVERVMEALPCQMFGDQAPSCVSSCCRLWWSHRFSRAGARPGVFQDTIGEKQKISHGNRITPPLQTHARLHTLCSH